MGNRGEGPCPRCGGNADATYLITRLGYPELRIDCFGASCRARGGAYLGDVGEILGVGRGATKEKLRRALEIYWGARATRAGRSGEPEPLPTDSALEGARARLWSDAEALAYLHGRGFADETIRRHGLAYSELHGRPVAFWILVRDRRGALVTVKERYFPDPWLRRGKKVWKRTSAGRGSDLYPALGDEQKVILTAGEFDAIVTAQEFEAAGIEGIAVVSPTTGTQIRDDLLEEFAGRRVALVYDIGEEDAAERNAARLREIGARRAWAVPLELPDEGDDLNSWFSTYGRSADELRELIRRAERAV